MIINNKKGISEKVLPILLAVFLMLLIIVLFFPSIPELIGSILGLSGGSDYCAESGMSSEEYNQEIEKSLFQEDTDRAVAYYTEYRECELSPEELTLENKEISIELAEGLCRRGKYAYSVEVFEGTPGEDNSDIEDLCRAFHNARKSLNTGKSEEAEKELVELEGLPSDSSLRWYLDKGEILLELGHREAAYYTYSQLYEKVDSYDTLPEFFLSWKQAALDNIVEHMKPIYLDILSEKFVWLAQNKDAHFCFETDPYVNGLTMFDIYNHIPEKNKTEVEQAFNEQKPDVTFNYYSGESNRYVCHNEYQEGISCWNNAKEDIIPKSQLSCKQIIKLAET